MPSQPKTPGSSELPKKLKSKSKSKSKAAVSPTIDTSADPAEDEEAILLRKYQTITGTLEEADWEALQNNPNVELWAIRVPRNLAVETLDDFEISIPSSSSGNSTAFKKNGVTYSVSSIDAEQLETSNVPAAAEMQSLTCLLPSQSRNGQLYPAPKPFSRKIVIVESPIDPVSILKLPTKNAKRTDGRFPHGRSKRPSQPTHLLKHSFNPIGADVAAKPGPQSAIGEATMDVDKEGTTQPAKKSKRKHYEGDADAVEAPRKKDKVKKSKRTNVDGA